MTGKKFKTAAAVAVSILFLFARMVVPEVHAADGAGSVTFSSFDPPSGPAGQKQFDAGGLNWDGADLAQVLKVYEQVSARTLIRGDGLPEAKITLRNETALSRVETLQLLDTVLAENGVTMVLAGASSVKAVPSAKATNETAPTITLPAEQLPESGSYMRLTVPAANLQALRENRTQVLGVLSMFAGFSRSITADPSGTNMVITDYAANIRVMLRLLAQLDPANGIVRDAQAPNVAHPPLTVSSFDAPIGRAVEPQFAVGALNLDDADLATVLNLYQKASGRTVICAGNLPFVKVTLHHPAAMNRVETLQFLDNALAKPGIGVTMLPMGEKTVRAVRNPQSGGEVLPYINLVADQLPDSSSLMVTTVRLKNADADLMVKELSLKSKHAAGIIYAPVGHLLILRDYASSIRQMLRLIQDEDH